MRLMVNRNLKEGEQNILLLGYLPLLWATSRRNPHAEFRYELLSREFQVRSAVVPEQLRPALLTLSGPLTPWPRYHRACSAASSSSRTARSGAAVRVSESASLDAADSVLSF